MGAGAGVCSRPGADEEGGFKACKGLKGLTLEAVPWSWALGSWGVVVRKQGNE